MFAQSLGRMDINLNHYRDAGNPATHRSSWQGMLDAAASPAEVLAVARDYLATLAPEELAMLPRALRPGKMVDAEDLNGYAFELVRAQYAVDPSAAGLVEKMGSFFSHAAHRASCLLAQSVAASAEGA